MLKRCKGLPDSLLHIRLRLQAPTTVQNSTNMAHSRDVDAIYSKSQDWYQTYLQVGWDMKARAGKKAVVLELGGNAAAVVEDYRSDAELDAIIGKITFGAFYQSGQSCISLQRLLIRQVRQCSPLQRL